LNCKRFYILARCSKRDCYRIWYRSSSFCFFDKFYRRLERSVEPRGRVCLHRVADVRIKIKRGGDRGMPQPLLHDFWMYVSSQLLCGMAAPDQAGFHRLSWRGASPYEGCSPAMACAHVVSRHSHSRARPGTRTNSMWVCVLLARYSSIARRSTRRRLDAFAAAQ